MRVSEDRPSHCHLFQDASCSWLGPRAFSKQRRLAVVFGTPSTATSITAQIAFNVTMQPTRSLVYYDFCVFSFWSYSLLSCVAPGCQHDTLPAWNNIAHLKYVTNFANGNNKVTAQPQTLSHPQSWGDNYMLLCTCSTLLHISRKLNPPPSEW